MGLESRTRRDAATTRILNRQSDVPDLIDYCDPRPRLASRETDVGSLDIEEIKRSYDLNKTQSEAFVDILSIRPIGLLQGPPGTGKTRFIAGLVHFVLTQGYAKNVLLASQANEVVNNAAEELLRLFHSADDQPSFVRVGHEGAVSERLLPFHAGRVETGYKDRFRAGLKERMPVVAKALGIPPGVCDEIIYIEQTVRPAVERLQSLRGDLTDAAEERTRGLWSTIRQMSERLDISLPATSVEVDGDIIGFLAHQLVSKHAIGNSEIVDRLRAVFQMGRDFVGSVSSQGRSFETFLAGTRRIVAGTCVGLGRSSLGLVKTPFDLVIIDEAARCTASELAVPMQCGRWIVLVGDQAQLEPQHRSEVVDQVAAVTRCRACFDLGPARYP